jgi:hypothetical protein
MSNCPDSEAIARHADGAAPSAALEAHIIKCAACAAIAREAKAAAAFLRNVAEPGPDCPDAESMALMIERGAATAHVESCPRCQAEFGALRTKRSTTRIVYKPRRSGAWGAAAAAVAVVAVALAIAYAVRSEPQEVAKETPKKTAPPPVHRVPDLPKPDVKPEPRPEPKPEVKPEPQAEPRVEPKPEPKPEPQPEPKPEPKPEPPPTVPEPARAEVAVAVKSGALSSDGKKVAKVLEGMALRADGRTRIEFAGATVTLDAATRFSLATSELALVDGGVSVEAPRGSKFSLLLGTTAIVPATAHGRVLLVAREDRVIVDEGSAKAGGAVLGEGQEHELKAGKLVARKRSLPVAVRPRERSTWVLDVQDPNATRQKLDNGKLVMLPTGRAIQSMPRASEYFYADIQYFAGGDAVTFVVKPTTAIRFRYQMKEAGDLHFQIKNKTKDENFSITLDGVGGPWTTVTLPVADIPVNVNGKKVSCEVGDQYGRFTWSVGTPGKPAEILVDHFEILEIER